MISPKNGYKFLLPRIQYCNILTNESNSEIIEFLESYIHTIQLVIQIDSDSSIFPVKISLKDRDIDLILSPTGTIFNSIDHIPQSENILRSLIFSSILLNDDEFWQKVFYISQLISHYRS